MRALALLLVLTLGPAAGARAQEPADLLLTNGKIFTADDMLTIARTVVVRDGRIVAVGGDRLRERYRAARVIDLGGRFVAPGFNDTHIHVRGRPRRYVHLAGVRSIAEIQERVRRKAAELGPGEWITGWGWSEDELVEGRRPLRADLDEAAPANPVLLARAGGHSSVANSLALRLAGITRTTPDPEGGVIERDATGEPNGILRERADLVGRLVPEPAPEEIRESLVGELRGLLALGVTSLIQAGETIEGFRLWESVYREHGDTLPRAAVQIRERSMERLDALGRKTGDGDERLRVGAVKCIVDGGFTGPAAWTLEPYRNEPGYYGKLLVPENELYELVRGAHERGWQLGFHAIGDAAIRLTVDVFARVLAERPRDDHRHYLNHFTVLPPRETLVRMAENNILIAQQPNFTYTLEGRYRAYLDGERLARNNALRTPLRYGIFVALGSDILPIGPMVGLYAAVTRRGPSGTVYAEDEALTLPEALVAYTRNGAYLTFEEDLKGTLEPGKLADLVVLSEDLLTIDPERLLDVEVEMTILGGRIVYERAATP